MSRIETLRRQVSESENRIDQLEKVIDEKKALIKIWEDAQEDIERLRKIRDVALNGWYLFKCLNLHKHRYLDRQIHLDTNKVTCSVKIKGDDYCMELISYAGRIAADAEEIQGWKNNGYLPKRF